MSWECPYLQWQDREPFCVRLDRSCDPVQKGCVLYGKVQPARVIPESSLTPPPPDPSDTSSTGS